MLEILQKELPIKISEHYFIRSIKNDDTEGIYELYRNEKISKYCARKTYNSLEEADEFINTVNERMKDGNNIYLGICDEASQKLIGIIRFLQKEEPSNLTIGYALNEQYWGQGIVPAAVSKLIQFIKLEGRYSRLRATVRPDNFKSQRCLEKIGFELVGNFMKSEIIENEEVKSERLLYIKKL